MPGKLNINYIAKRGVTLDGSEVTATAINSKTNPYINNLIVNGSFDKDSDWTQASDYWSISNGKANAIAGTTTSYQYLDQLITVADVGTYEAQIEVTDFVTGLIFIEYTAGTATFTADTSNSLSENGILTRKFYITIAGTLTIRVRAYNNTVASVDNFKFYNLNDETIGKLPTDLITNGDFPTATTGWTAYQNAGTAVISVVSGQLLVDNNSSATYGRAYQAVTTVVGQAYEVICDLAAVTTSAGIWVSTSTSSGTLIASTGPVSSPGVLRTNFIATATTTYIQLVITTATTTDTATFDNVTVRASNDLITNGEFGNDVSWTKGLWTITSGAASVSAPGSTTYLDQVITIPTPGTWELAIEVTAISANTVYLRNVAGTAIYTAESVPTTTTTGWLRQKVYVAAAGTMTFRVQANGATVATVDNASCWLVEDDQSIANDNGFEVHGQLRRVAVAPGADLRAYTGFSSDNYLRQPYTSAMDVGTGDFTFNIWVKRNNVVSLYEYFFMRSSSVYDTANAISLIHGNTGNGTFYIYVGGTGTILTTPRTTLGEWSMITVTKISGTTYLYVNAELQDTSASSYSITSSNAVLQLGTGGSPSTNNPLTSSDISNFKFINSALTASQIKNLYESEKGLFKRFASYQLKGASYDLQTTANFKQQSQNIIKVTNKALDGTTESIINRTEYLHSIETDLIPYYALSPWREFLFSCRGDETFTLTPGGGVEPDEAITASLESVDHTETRINGPMFIRYNFTIRERLE